MGNKFKLTPDQFQFDANGSLLINRDEIAQVVKSQQDVEVFPPEEATKISIEVT